MRNVYVLALVEKPLAETAASEHRIEFLPTRGIYAVVERRASAPDMNEASLRAQHKMIVDLARLCDPILPVRFGAWVPPDELLALIESREGLLRDAFELVRHREQMTVRVFGKSALERSESMGTAESGRAYLERLRDAARPRLPPLAHSVRRAVGSLAIAERLESGHGRMHIAVHHLIERGRSDRYRTLVRRAASTMPTDGELMVSGPWPPFAFTPELWP